MKSDRVESINTSMKDAISIVVDMPLAVVVCRTKLSAE